MPVNSELVGKVYPASTYEVGREKIREFAFAVADDSASDGLVAPPTFAIVVVAKAMSAAMHDDELGLDYSRVVHGEQKFEHARAIVAGDVLTTVGSIDMARTVAGNDFVTVKSVVTDADGALVCTAYSTLIARAAGEDE